MNQNGKPISFKMSRASNFFCTKAFIFPLLIMPFIALFCINQKKFYTSAQTIRQLIEEVDEDNLKDICSKYSDLYEYYYEDKPYTPSEIDFGQMSDGSYIIMNYLENDYNGLYLLQYLWYINKYTFFTISLLLIVFFTIYYNLVSFLSFCTGKNCGNIFKFSCCKSKILQLVACIIAPIVYIAVLVIASASVSFSQASLNRFAGTVCVGFQFVNSLIDGESGKKEQKWGGIDIVSNILSDLEDLIKQNNQDFIKIIYNDKKNFDKQSMNWAAKIQQSLINHINKNITLKSPKMENIHEGNISILPNYAYYWEDIIDEIDSSWDHGKETISFFFNIIENYLYNLFGCEINSDTIDCKENSIISFLLGNGAGLISYLKTPFKNFRNILVKPISNIYEGINNVLYYFFVIVVVFVIIYCSIMVLVLAIFFCSKFFRKDKDIKSCIRWNLCHIYFTSLIIVIIGFIVGIGIGFIGNFIKDLTNVIENITSSENLKSEFPIIIGQSNVSRYLDVCLNGDGDLARELNLSNAFNYINQVIELTDESDNLTNITNTTESPAINKYIKMIETSVNNYLNISYYDIEKEEPYKISDNLKEINNYVSGKYSNEDASCNLINETWDITKEKEGYIYDENYPNAAADKNYLIYLYDEDVYNKANILKDRYINACPTPGKPYETVNEASKDFGKFFNNLKNEITSDKFNKEFIDDLKELNQIYGEKNKYVNSAAIEIKKFIAKLNKFLKNYATNDGGIFSLLNCKFVGENKLILMSILYTSLGVYLDKYGTLTSLWSFFIFVALIFIIIVIRNYDTDDNDNNTNINYLLPNGQIELQMKEGSNQELI